MFFLKSGPSKYFAHCLAQPPPPYERFPPMTKAELNIAISFRQALVAHIGKKWVDTTRLARNENRIQFFDGNVETKCSSICHMWHPHGFVSCRSKISPSTKFLGRARPTCASSRVQVATRYAVPNTRGAAEMQPASACDRCIPATFSRIRNTSEGFLLGSETNVKAIFVEINFAPKCTQGNMSISVAPVLCVVWKLDCTHCIRHSQVLMFASLLFAFRTIFSCLCKFWFRA